MFLLSSVTVRENCDKPVNSRVKKFQESWMSYSKAFIEAWPRKMDIKQYKFT